MQSLALPGARGATLRAPSRTPRSQALAPAQRGAQRRRAVVVRAADPKPPKQQMLVRPGARAGAPLGRARCAPRRRCARPPPRPRPPAPARGHPAPCRVRPHATPPPRCTCRRTHWLSTGSRSRATRRRRRRSSAPRAPRRAGAACGALGAIGACAQGPPGWRESAASSAPARTLTAAPSAPCSRCPRVPAAAPAAAPHLAPLPPHSPCLAKPQLGRILIYEAVREFLPTVEGTVDTPVGTADVEFVDPTQPIKVGAGSGFWGVGWGA
jgi:hypothetical protein